MKAVLLKLDDGLIAKIDAERGDVPRTVWITRACEQRVEIGRIAAAATEAKDEAMTTGAAYRKITLDKNERVAPESVSVPKDATWKPAPKRGGLV